MRGQMLPTQAVSSNSQNIYAQGSYVSSNDAIALGTFSLLFPLMLLVIMARRQYRQRLIQQHLLHLERSWQLNPFHNSH